MRVLLLVCLLGATSESFAEEKTRFSIGDKAPSWKELKNTDGRLVSLADFAETDVIVLCFTCNTCPYSVDYEDRMISFQKSYAGDGKVQLIAINSNLIKDDSLDAMKKRAKEKTFNFPYLKDESQDVARSYDAIYTPEFFVLNRERVLVYKGAMDDATNADAATVNYVDLAVKAALKGERPKQDSVGARGCAIRFKRRRR